MTGKVLIWATRPHPNNGALLVVLRNTVLTAGDTAPWVAEGASGGRRARAQRQVMPTPVTCIAFRHHAPVESDPPEIAAATAPRASQPKTTAAKREKKTEALDRRDKQEGSTTAPASNISKTQEFGEVGTLLLTGDELGSIKVWDLTDVLLDKLGPATCRAKATGDKATIPPSSFGAASHHFIHYRQGPLDGVGLQAGIRFRELIDIARVLRRGEYLKNPESDSDSRLYRADLSSDGGRSLDGKRTKRRPSGEKSSTGSQSASSAVEKSRDQSLSTRRKQQGLSLGRTSTEQAGSVSALMSPRGTASDVRESQQRARRRLGSKEQAEATLNARPDDIDPVASWTVHEDSITFVETISSPPSILTGSLDSSARLISWDGSLLGVMAEKKKDNPKRGRWLFQPPPKGRNTEASTRAATLEQRLKTVRHEERQPVSFSGGRGNSVLPTDLRAHGRCALSSLLCKAPADGSEIGTGSAALKRDSTSPHPGGRAERIPASAKNSMDGASREKRRVATAEDKGLLPTQSAISAVCFARIKELSHVRVAAEVSSSDTESESLRAVEDGMEARLLSEAREGREDQLGGDIRQPVSSSTIKREGRDRRHGYHHNAKSPTGASKPSLPVPPKLPPNLSAEQERKHAKRTRSMLQYLSNTLTRTNDAKGPEPTISPPSISESRENDSVKGPRVMEGGLGDGRRVTSRPFTSPGIRGKCPTKKGKLRSQDDFAAMFLESTVLTPASKLRHAVAMAAPHLTLNIINEVLVPSTEKAEEVAEGGGEGERGQSGGSGTRNTGRTAREEFIPLTLKPVLSLTHTKSTASVHTQRSAVTLTSARSQKSTRSEISSVSRPIVSTKAAVARRLAADRRRRRMDCILDGVRCIGQQETAETSPFFPLGFTHDDELNPTVENERARELGTTGGWGRGGGTVVISTRVQEVLSSFDRSVNSENDNRDNDPNNQTAKTAVKSIRRQLDARTAAKKEAIRHNERYRRAQRYDLIALQETQQRRQEAMVGLTGPSAERFGPYSLDDVLEFQVFANHLNVQGAQQLTVASLLENPDIQSDPYSHALLQELVRSRVLQWNQPLSLEDLMKVHRPYYLCFRKTW